MKFLADKGLYIRGVVKGCVGGVSGATAVSGRSTGGTSPIKGYTSERGWSRGVWGAMVGGVC